MKDKIINIMKEEFNEEIDENFSKFSTDEWDSFKHLSLVSRLEEEFNISFTPDEIGEMESLKDIIKIVNEKI